MGGMGNANKKFHGKMILGLKHRTGIGSSCKKSWDGAWLSNWVPSTKL